MPDAVNIRATSTAMAPKKGTRKSMPKVRTGCRTCKQRRVKCDEGKPSCLNCSRAGRQCEGYPVPMNGQGKELQRQQRLDIRVYSLPFKVPGSQADRQLLHFYCVEAAGSLSSFSDPTLWTTLILQRSHHQPVIRNALVTLAGLYREYLLGGNSIQPSGSQLAMQRIAKCHRQLRLYLRTPDASVETPLICSILFYVFETLVGDASSAIQHLNSGLNLLRRTQARSHDYSDDILPHLIAIFSRLDVQASAFDDLRVPILTLVSPEEMSGLVGIVPDTMSSLSEAEAALTKLQNWMMHHIIAYLSHKNQSMDQLPQGLIHERFVLYQQYERFLDALSILLASLPVDMMHRALLLRIQALMYHAILLENIPKHTPPSSSNPSSGYSTPSSPGPNDSLQSALLDTQQFLSSLSAPDTPRHFTLCSQLVAILYFLCLKTTDPQSQETALALLRHSRLPARDGLWEAQKAISIVQTLLGRAGAGPEGMCRLEDVGEDVFSHEIRGMDQVFREITARSVERVDDVR
ncbi:hypothetical protein BJX68DRAFT_237483 [Aspergillus pseudodeflectus]|uniref:Zn(2)-C6 fungal-type domain-containing protein n=1 Tax=Aspergillus pseudodeflectus TaxID=176178 RepID=A0ABR4KBL0_9EURO